MLSIDDTLQNLSELRLCIINEEVGLGCNVLMLDDCKQRTSNAITLAQEMH